MKGKSEKAEGDVKAGSAGGMSAKAVRMGEAMGTSLLAIVNTSTSSSLAMKTSKV